jgi:hypothetical protein
MRMKKTIDRLSTRVERVVFPKLPDLSFTRFQEDLRQVLSDNDLDADWDFDEASQTFYTTWERRVEAAHLGSGLTLHRNVHLDPRKPLVAEIQRLLDEQTNMNRQAIEVAVAIRALT